MNEEDTPNVDEVVQSAPMASLNETNNKKSMFRRVGSMIGGKKSKDKMASVSEENLVAQLTKERDRYKVAHLTSEAEKKEIISKMEYQNNLQAKDIENLKMDHQKTIAETESVITKMECEAKVKSAEIDNLKKELDNLNEKLQASSDEIERCKIELNSKASRMTEMVNEIQLKSVGIESLKRQCEILNKKLQTDTSKFDRCKNELDSKTSRMNEMDHEIKSKSAEIEKLEAKIDNETKLKAVEIENMKITQLNTEVEWKLQLNKMENDVNSKAQEIEFLQRMEDQLKSAMARMDNEISSKAEKINKLKRKLEEEAARSNLELDDVNQKLDESRRDIDRYKKQEGELNTQISLLKKEVEISGDVSRGFAKVEKNLRSLVDRPSDMTIRWKFTEISKLTAESVYSQPNELAGVIWRIQLCKDDGQLALYLEGKKFIATKWSCTVLAEFQLISQQDNGLVERFLPEKPLFYSDKESSWGSHLIPFRELLSGNAVKDDSIIIAVAIKVFPSN